MARSLDRQPTKALPEIQLSFGEETKQPFRPNVFWVKLKIKAQNFPKYHVLWIGLGCRCVLPVGRIPSSRLPINHSNNLISSSKNIQAAQVTVVKTGVVQGPSCMR
jgi:hypothetical protein